MAAKPADQQPAASTPSTPTVAASTPSEAAAAPAAGKNANGHNTPSKIRRRSSKPIINWLQRKLGSSGKSKKPNENNGSAVPAANVPPVPKNRVVSTPVNGTSPKAKTPKVDTSTLPTRRKTISLNEDEEPVGHSGRQDNLSIDSSVARGSAWSPTNASADEDASMRPLPPSSPPSPSPSRSSSSHISEPKTFRSVAASTKPTTLLSIDLNGGGMAHIAQAPLVTPTTSRLNPHHAHNSSTATNPAPGSISFSALPPSSPVSTADPVVENDEHVQAPQHTSHHPRNNPRPSSPPLDNASMLTLASSAYAIPGLRQAQNTVAAAAAGAVAGSGPPSAVAADNGSTYADAESSRFPGEDEIYNRDVDASVRALRPRSSRRGSWESELSRWSARPGGGTPSRSLWTGGGSVKTGGGFSAEAADDDDEDDDDEDDDDDEADRRTDITHGETMENGTAESGSPLASKPQELPEPNGQISAPSPLAQSISPDTSPVNSPPPPPGLESSAPTADAPEPNGADIQSHVPAAEPEPIGDATPQIAAAEPKPVGDDTPQIAAAEPEPSGDDTPQHSPQAPPKEIKMPPPPVDLDDDDERGPPSPALTEMSRDEVWHSVPSTPAPLQSPILYGS